MQTNHVVRLSKKENLIQIGKFVLFSISAGVIQVLVFTVLEELVHLPYWPSYLTALIASVIYNFTVNRRFTFKSANNVPKAMMQLGIYYALFTPLSTWWGDALVALGISDYLVLGGTMIINLVTEFCVNRFIIYRTSMNTRMEREHTNIL
ncbi:GtrA family protein [Sphaerochaeta globosa]|uniref:GtrA family protein n=1 Tax=Sphaerochaeta globosa (strain ATCC BAA-1886 / DSM 22777 / Buddy) TaxID=158189 RepID=F0RU04_SPHGB|nr:GtrA family protein [Sphaerochaeta globosa]ADY13863.1 GtrA family protein [Sphaerochaeta globosa str. Buddy]